MSQKEIVLSVDNASKATLQHWVAHPEQFQKVIPSTEPDRLAKFVFEHLQDKDGSPEVTNIRIDTFVWSKETGQGRFRLHFEINRRFCCSDTCATGLDYIDFQFRLKGNRLIASGSYFDWTLDN